MKIAAIILLLSLNAIYVARVLGSVFRIVFRLLIREFESVETSPGFAQLLGENLVSFCKIADRFHDTSKKLVKVKSLEGIIVILRKNCKYSRVPNKRTGRLLENDKKSHLYALVQTYKFINFQQKVPPICLFPLTLLLIFVLFMAHFDLRQPQKPL